MVFALMTSCSGPKQDKKKISIVTTIFPEYDWVNQILGDRKTEVDVNLLLDKGVDLHSYQATVDDMVKITTCDMFIYVGGESDAWADKMIKESGNDKMVVVNLLEVLGEKAKEEEHKEGMQEEEHDHDHDDHEEETEYDEHVWLSLKNASLFCSYIARKLGEIDKENKDVYADNAGKYIEKLNKLDSEYKAAVDSASMVGRSRCLTCEWDLTLPPPTGL